MELVYMDGKKDPYTLSSIITECTNLQHHTITKTICKHQTRFEQFGKVGFKNLSYGQWPEYQGLYFE